MKEQIKKVIGQIFINMFYNLNESLGKKECRNTLVTGIILPIIIFMYMIFTNYLIKSKKLKKMEYKTLLSSVTLIIPLIILLFNFLITKLVDINKCGNTFYLSLSYVSMFIGIIFGTTLLIKSQYKKYVPLYLIQSLLIIGISLSVYNFFYNKKTLNHMIDFNLKSWENKWNKPYRKLTRSRQWDPYDTNTHRVGSGIIELGDGIMKLSGHQPRIYLGVHWQNFETEFDFLYTKESKGRGAIIGGRSHIKGHDTTVDQQTHTYYFKCGNDGKTGFIKERFHGYPTAEDGDRVALDIKKSSFLKLNEWNNIKFRCYNLGKNRVKLEGYVNGKLVSNVIDDGDDLLYNAKGVILIRSTDANSVQYKNFKARELDMTNYEPTDIDNAIVIYRKDQVNENARN